MKYLKPWLLILLVLATTLLLAVKTEKAAALVTGLLNYYPSADSYTNTISPDTNYGTTNTLRMGVLVGNSFETWLQFNISDLLDLPEIFDASLNLYVQSESGTPTVFLFHSHNDAWTETGITYNNKPGYDTPHLGTDTATGSSWLSFDISAKLISEWQADNDTISFRLNLTSADNVLCRSREYTGLTYDPYLNVNCTAYKYIFKGVFDEATGYQKAPAERAVNITAYYSTGYRTETFELNGTYQYNTSSVPLYFHFELGSKDRQFWLGQEETETADIYVFNDTLTTYTISFLDLAGILKSQPYVAAQRYINGSLMVVDKRKVDEKSQVVFNLVQDTKYDLSIGDGSTYQYGEVLFEADTTITLTVKGVDFPQEVLLVYKYVQVYAIRTTETGAGTDTITFMYNDTALATESVDIRIEYTNGSLAFSRHFAGFSTIGYSWTDAQNNTNYVFKATITHSTYGVLGYTKVLAFSRMFGRPFSLDFLGSLPFDTAYLIPMLLILFSFACFSVLNVYMGAFFGTVTAALLTMLGFIPITGGALVTSFFLTVLLALVYSRRGFRLV